jgi:hypothetical protein
LCAHALQEAARECHDYELLSSAYQDLLKHKNNPRLGTYLTPEAFEDLFARAGQWAVEAQEKGLQVVAVCQ